ncbi:hypothetical protein ACVBIL_15815 [Shewanella sp. 125m-7]
MKRSQLPILLTVTLSFSLLADSIVPTNEEQAVLKSCMALKNTSENLDTSSCIYYIQGFLAGSLTTKSNYVLRETSGVFLDRAYRTRVGNHISTEQPIPLCLPKNENIEHLAERLVGHLSHPIESMPLLHSQIFDALEVESSCS